jgi:hypothetical protein
MQIGRIGWTLVVARQPGLQEVISVLELRLRSELYEDAAELSVEEEVWERQEEKILPILEDRQGRVLGGVSEPAVRGRVVKLLAKSAPDLNAIFESIWAAARALLWGLPFPALRRYEPYQIPSPIITIPMTSQPKTPAAISASSVIPYSHCSKAL